MGKKDDQQMLEARFLDQIYEGYQAGKRYCFILGSGASRTSGIRTGEQMMKDWFSYLHKKGSGYLRDCAQELDKKIDNQDKNGGYKSRYERFFSEKYECQADDYFDLFDLRFAGQASVGYQFLETEMEGKYPSYGYFPLAMLLANTENRLAITTNFDSLIEDSLFIYTSKRPRVVVHESLAPYISNDFKRPVIAKIHRDLFFNPLNRQQDMQELADEWKAPLSQALSKYTPIVIGYSGGDHTLMSLFEKMEMENGIYWCHVNAEPSEHIREIMEKHTCHFVRIQGFDEVMFQIGERFHEEANFNDPFPFMQEETRRRYDQYKKSLEVIKTHHEPLQETIITASEDTKPHSDERQGKSDTLDTALEQYETRQSKMETENTDDPLSHIQRNIRLKKYEEAISKADEAIQQGFKNAEIYRLRGMSCNALKRYDQALEDMNQAVALSPENGRYLHERSLVYRRLEKYGQALGDIEKAIALSPDDKALYLTSKSVYLNKMSRNDEALKAISDAIALSPQIASQYNFRGIIYTAQEKYPSALRDFSQAIELSPARTNYYYNRAYTERILKMYDEALEDIGHAIELEPDRELFQTLRDKIQHDLQRQTQPQGIEKATV